MTMLLIFLFFCFQIVWFQKFLRLMSKLLAFCKLATFKNSINFLSEKLSLSFPSRIIFYRIGKNTF